MATPTSPIFNIFARSPIGPLQDHMGKVHACCSALPPFFQAVFVNDWTDAEAKRNVIASLEHEADDLKKELRLHLPKGLFMPVARGDILEMVTLQDNIANRAKDIAGIVLGRKMQFPVQVQELYMKFLNRSIDASAQAYKVMHELDNLLETGFGGGEISLVEEMIHELDSIENDTDAMQVAIRYELFQIEKQLYPVDVIFLYKIFDWTGDLADRAQRVGGQLQVMLAK
ncbi:MAG: TIGR00153 family protein [Gammaproteobacteria bacterium]